MDALLRRRIMMAGSQGAPSYIDWLRSIGCVVYLPLSSNGDLQDKISGNSLVLTGNGSLTWDSGKGKYKIYTGRNTSLGNNNIGVAKLVNAIPASLFTDDCNTTLTTFEKISPDGYYVAGQIGFTTNVSGQKPALCTIWNGSTNVANFPTGELKLARYIGTDERLYWQNGALYGTYAAYSDYLPSNWNAINSDLNIGSNREDTDAYFNKYYYLSEVYIFKTKLTLSQIRRIQGYE